MGTGIFPQAGKRGRGGGKISLRPRPRPRSRIESRPRPCPCPRPHWGRGFIPNAGRGPSRDGDSPPHRHPYRIPISQLFCWAMMIP